VRLHVLISDRIDVSGGERRSTLMVLTCLNLSESETSDKGTHFVSSKVDIYRLAVGGKDPQTNLAMWKAAEDHRAGRFMAPSRREFK
jgi:hypothetical protein